MAIIDISVEIPALPGGWRGTPDDLFQFLVINGVFHIEGDFPTGQVGGSRPTQDVGIWYGDNSIERFINGKYRPVSDLPVASVVIWASTGLVAPENFIFCTGQSLIRADYPELFAAIGVTYGFETGLTFKVPDYRGRAPFGAGVGDYLLQGVTGKMREIVAGKYSGFEWPRNGAKAVGAPKTTKLIPGTVYAGNSLNTTDITPPSVGQQFLIRYR